MSLTAIPGRIIQTAGYYIGHVIGFLVIFAAGLVVLWITMEPYH